MEGKKLLEGLKISNVLLKACFSNIKEAAKEKWESPLLRHYTRHGPDHSERVIDRIGGLLEVNPSLLNEHERFLLLASAYLHDIGMQYPTYAGLPYKSKYSFEELEKVRENHHEAGAKIIYESISNKPALSLGLEQCKDYGNFLATITRYHRKLDINELRDAALHGEKIRLPLLVALLRLGDALDADNERVNMEILKARDIPVESKRHWWFHYYVQSVFIERGIIKLYFRFPEVYRGEKVLQAICSGVIDSIKKQFIEVYDILDSYGIRLYRDIRIEREEYHPEGLELIPDDLLEYLKEYALKTVALSEEKTKTTGVVWFVDGVPYSDDITVVECLKAVFTFIDEGRNLYAAKEIERCRNLVMAPKERMIFLNVAGNCHYILGNLRKAEDYYKDVLKISGRSDLQEIYKDVVISAKASALGNIGLIYSDKGDLDKALKYLQEALVIDKEIGYKQGEASDLGNIGLIYSAKGDLDKALKYHNEAQAIHKEIGYKQGEASDLGNIGLIYSNKGDLDKALKYHNEAQVIHKEIGYKQGEASALGNIGLIYSDKGDLDKALKYLQEALVIGKEIGYKQGEASALGNIGLIYSAKGDLDKAMRYLQEALVIDKEIGYKQGEASALGNIGFIYKAKGDLDKALKYLQEAQVIHKEIGYKQGEASDLGNIGLIYKAKGDLDKALKYHKDALTIDKEIGYKQGEASDLGNIGLIYTAKGDLDEALKYHKDALTILNKYNLLYGRDIIQNAFDSITNRISEDD